MISYMAEAQIIWTVWETIQTKKEKKPKKIIMQSTRQLSRNVKEHQSVSECVYILGGGGGEWGWREEKIG